MLIVNTDHGYLMGEHDWWAKMASPLFNEVAHVPFWVYDPRIPQAAGKRYALTQTMDGMYIRATPFASSFEV